jgi:hypothetical protein
MKLCRYLFWTIAERSQATIWSFLEKMCLDCVQIDDGDMVLWRVVIPGLEHHEELNLMGRPWITNMICPCL